MRSRINEIRRKISALRPKMLAERDAVRDQIKHDLDCAESSLRLLAMRADLSALVRQWKAAGGGERLPTVRERLTENYRPVQRPRSVPMPKVQKQRLSIRV
jgi:hypothetical protein